MRKPCLRHALAAAAFIPAAFGLSSPAWAVTSPQSGGTPDVTADVYYGHEVVLPGGANTMTIDLINNGPSNLDDSTRFGLKVTLPQDTTTDSTLVESIPGNAPSGDNAVKAVRLRPASDIFATGPDRSLTASFDAGSYGNGKVFRSYTLTLHVSGQAEPGSVLDGGGVVVTMGNQIRMAVSGLPASAPRPGGHTTRIGLPKMRVATCVPGENDEPYGRDHRCEQSWLANTGTTAGPDAVVAAAGLFCGLALLWLSTLARRVRHEMSTRSGRLR